MLHHTIEIRIYQLHAPINPHAHLDCPDLDAVLGHPAQNVRKHTVALLVGRKKGRFGMLHQKQHYAPMVLGQSAHGKEVLASAGSGTIGKRAGAVVYEHGCGLYLDVSGCVAVGYGIVYARLATANLSSGYCPALQPGYMFGICSLCKASGLYIRIHKNGPFVRYWNAYQAKRSFGGRLGNT